MRLINTETLELEEFVGNNVPKYAILSHTWGNKELTYNQFLEATTWIGYSYTKIKATCREASKRGLRYAWIDSCCIDKSSSSELSEAINSMFRWYEESEVCFAFLVDVVYQQGMLETSFKASRWFTRGWTLQELLAPRKLEFFDTNWSLLGTRHDLSCHISSITGINEIFLIEDITSSRHNLLHTASIAERMSWAAKRVTTRQEDVAYCLLGILGVTMPLIYGEGTNAFLRLQEKVIYHSFDISLLAWNHIRNGATLTADEPPKYSPWLSVYNMIAWKEHPWSSEVALTGEEDDWFKSGINPLALSPSYFLNAEDIVTRDLSVKWSATSQGLEITLPISQNQIPYLLLPCYPRDDPRNLLALPLLKQKDGTYLRACVPPKLVSSNKWHQWEWKTLILTTKGGPCLVDRNSQAEKCDILIRSIPPCLHITKIYINGVLAPCRNSKRAAPNSGPFLRNNNEAAVIVFKAEAYNTTLALRLWQSRDKLNPFFWGSHDTTHLNCSFGDTDTFEPISSSQRALALEEVQEYLGLGSKLLYTRVVRENTLNQHVYFADVILCTGQIHKFFLRIQYDVKAWFKGQARSISRISYEVSSEGHITPIARIFNFAAFLVPNQLMAIKGVITITPVFLVFEFIGQFVGNYLGTISCSNDHPWADFVTSTVELTGSVLSRIPISVVLAVSIVQLLPIVCCFWPQMSYFTRRYSWIIAAVFSVIISTLESSIGWFPFIWSIMFSWTMSWWFTAGNSWTGSQGFMILPLIGATLQILQFLTESTFDSMETACNVEKGQTWSFISHGSIFRPDETYARLELSNYWMQGFMVIVWYLWLSVKIHRITLIELGLFHTWAI